MKTLGFAFVIVLAAATVCFGVLAKFGVADKVAAPIAGVLFGAITYVHQALEQRTAKPRLALAPQHIVSLEGFGLSPLLMIVYGSLLVVAALGSAGVLGGLAAGIGNVKEEDIVGVGGLVAFPTAVFALYLVGHWTGVRCSARGVLVIFTIVLASRALISIPDVFLISDAEFLKLYAAPRTLLRVTEYWGLGVAFFGIVAGAGYWRGRRRRLGAYLAYLVKRLPGDTGNTLVTLAYDEAKKLQANVRAA